MTGVGWLLRAVTALALTAALQAQGAQTVAAPKMRAPQGDAITAGKLRADLTFLAGDGMRGRLVESPENVLAHEWVRSRFESLGLAPAGPGGSWYLPVPLLRTSMGGNNELTVERAGVRTGYATGDDFHARAFSATAHASGALVFAGFGIVAPALKRDELAGDLRGKVVLLLDHEPGENDPASPFDGVVTSEFANQARRALDAQERGAVGVLFVADVLNHPEPEDFGAVTRAYWPARPARLERYQLASAVQAIQIPVGQVSVSLVRQLLRGSGRTLEALAQSAERGTTPFMIAGVSVTLTTNIVRRTVTLRNVAARLDGSDPALKDEFVVIAAHVDHNGSDGDQVWNGADDDGSGTVALLAVAEAYSRAAAAGERPRRSVLFLSLNAEERGPLLGAWAYAEAPAVPLASTVAVLNMDMVGRSEEVPEGGGPRFRGLAVQSAESNRRVVNLLGWSRSASLDGVIERASVGTGLTLKRAYDNNVSQLLRRTDMWPFLQRGVPSVTFFTGLHPDYHTMYDRPEKIEYEKLERIARLVHQVSWDLAQSSTRPALNIH